MSNWNHLFFRLDTPNVKESDSSVFSVNPATGLPMIDDICGVDVEGNPFGVDLGSSLHESTADIEIFSLDSDWS